MAGYIALVPRINGEFPAARNWFMQKSPFLFSCLESVSKYIRQELRIQCLTAISSPMVTTPLHRGPCKSCVTVQPHPLIGSVWAANPSGKPSKSLAKVISRTTSTTTFEVSLNSGRPHQIRIHLASIGHPLGDPLYGLTGQPLENLPGLPGDGGYFLHAHFLKFHHPITGEQINLEAASPSGFSLHQ